MTLLHIVDSHKIGYPYLICTQYGWIPMLDLARSSALDLLVKPLINLCVGTKFGAEGFVQLVLIQVLAFPFLAIASNMGRFSFLGMRGYQRGRILKIQCGVLMAMLFSSRRPLSYLPYLHARLVRRHTALALSSDL